MKDVCGKELAIGDTVVTMFDEYAQLTICRIETIAKQKVGLSIINKSTAAPITQYRSNTVRYKFPFQIAKVDYESH